MRFWDSSAIVPLLVPEKESDKREQEWTEDQVMAVWWGTRVEIESALRRRFRDKSISEETLREAELRLRKLEATWHVVSPSSSIATLATRLVRTHPLRAADAFQLAAALSLGMPVMFLSGDARLNKAAEIELC